MALALSSATIVADDSGNMITKNMTTSWQNMNSLTFSLKRGGAPFSMSSNGRIQYSGLLATDCIVSARYSLASATYGTSMGICIYKNGSMVAGTDAWDLQAPGVINAEISMSNGDYLEVWGKATQSITPCELISCELDVIA